MEQRKGEGRGLPRPGRGLREDIPSRQQGGDRGALDRGRLLVAEGGQRVEDARVEREVGEARGDRGVQFAVRRVRRSRKPINFPRSSSYSERRSVLIAVRRVSTGAAAKIPFSSCACRSL